MLLTSLLGPCAVFSPTENDDGYVHEAEVAGPPGFWALVHRTDPPARGPGVYWVDTALDAVDDPLVLPDLLLSPHALFDDGGGLLVGGVGDEPGVGEPPGYVESLFRLDYDGTELDAYVVPRTEGIAGSDGLLYVSEDYAVHELDVHLLELRSVEVESIVQDIAVHDRTLYVLTNDDYDIIRAYDLDNPTAPSEVVTDRATFDNTGYAMMVWNGRLLVADTDAGGHFLRHLDLETGEPLGITRFELDGWVTAIAVPAE